MAKKLISVVVPTYNEEENVRPLAEAIIEIMEHDLPKYDYEIIYIDNHSTDRTRAILREMCGENKKIKAQYMMGTLATLLGKPFESEKPKSGQVMAMRVNSSTMCRSSTVSLLRNLRRAGVL